MINLITTQCNLQRHADEPGNAYAPGITNRSRTEREFPVFAGHRVQDLRKRIHIHQTAQQAFPEYDEEYEINVGYEVEDRVEGEKDEVKDLEEGRKI